MTGNEIEDGNQRMHRLIKNVLAPVLLCVTFVVADGQSTPPALTIPNQFTAGTSAKAADVNANFNAVAGAVNANASNITALQQQVGSNGKAIGTVQTFLNGSAGAIFLQSGNTSLGAMAYLPLGDSVLTTVSPDTDLAVFAVNGNGFFIALDAGGTLVQPTPMTTEVNFGLFYSGNNCTGTTYLGTPGGPVGSIALLLTQGLVFGAWDASDPNQSYYAKGPVEATALSVGAPGNCYTPGTSTQIYAAPVLPNDPSVTGVPLSLTGPLKLLVH